MRHPTRRSSVLSAVVLAGVVLVGVQPVLESTAAPVDLAAASDRLVVDATGEVRGAHAPAFSNLGQPVFDACLHG